MSKNLLFYPMTHGTLVRCSEKRTASLLSSNIEKLTKMAEYKKIAYALNVFTSSQPIRSRSFVTIVAPTSFAKLIIK